jgi:hypothetical protein
MKIQHIVGQIYQLPNELRDVKLNMYAHQIKRWAM